MPRPGLRAATRTGICAHDAAASRSLLQAALALQHCRARHGRYPDDPADASVDGFEVPSDVYGGRPLIYGLDRGRFTLRSVDLNLVKDGELCLGDDIIWVSG